MQPKIVDLAQISTFLSTIDSQLRDQHQRSICRHHLLLWSFSVANSNSSFWSFRGVGRHFFLFFFVHFFVRVVGLCWSFADRAPDHWNVRATLMMRTARICKIKNDSVVFRTVGTSLYVSQWKFKNENHGTHIREMRDDVVARNSKKIRSIDPSLYSLYR